MKFKERAASRQQSAPDGKKSGERADGGHGAKPAQQRDAAILALLACRTIAEAARQCGVSERTLFRWTTENQAFKRDLAEARRAVFDAGLARIQALTGKAVDALDDCLGSASQTVKMQAVRTQLELVMYQQEVGALADKLASVERQIAEVLREPGR